MVSKRWLSVASGLGAVLAARELIGRMQEADLHGKVALITGASRGLGLAMARELADEGAKLVICARDEAELQRAAEELQRRGAEVLAVPCDVTDRVDVDRLVARALETFGQIDLLIANAGVIQVGQLKVAELEDFQQAMDIMFWGALYPILAVLPHMRERHEGRIAVVTSIGGKVSVPYLLPYNSAKFAAVGLSEGLRAELADEGIIVTTIVPGLMRTGSFLNAYFSGDAEGRDAEYRVFAPLSSLPPFAVSADKAAKVFIRAIKRGSAQCIYPLPYSLISRFHGLAPATTARLFSVADRLMPDSGDGTRTERGMDIDAKIESKPWRVMTALGHQAAEDLRQHPGPTGVPEPS